MKKSLLAHKTLLAISILTSSAVGFSQEAETKPNVALTAETVGSGIPEERRKAAEDLARVIAESSRNAASSTVGKKITDTAKAMSRRVDDIADTALAADRNKVLKFIGVDPEGESSVYYFVSHEMPIEVIRSYVIEAMWTGGTLVFKGVPKGQDLKTFINESLRELVYGKGSSAAISIDPRLFDAYQVTTVPTIVYTQERKNFTCAGMLPKEFKYQEQTYHYETCPPIDPSKYWKISGAVTSDFALREFISAGATRANVFLQALAKGFATGTVPPRNQQPYAGEWKEAITPEQLMLQKQAIESAKEAIAGRAASAPTDK